jgi:glutathione S-transferase
MLTLHQVEWCPHCHRVRQVLTELGLTYLAVNVPARQKERADVVALSGDPAVPVLEDGDRVVRHADEIVAYLRAAYPEPADADDHRAKSAYRTLVLSALSPDEAATRLKSLLEAQGFTVLAEVSGAAVSPRLPEGYRLVYATAAAAAAKAFEADPGVPAAMTLPFSIAPAAEGSLIAAPDPVGPVWVYGDLRLTKPLAALRGRLEAVFGGF